MNKPTIDKFEQQYSLYFGNIVPTLFMEKSTILGSFSVLDQ